jgi:hypothetical protein
VSVFLFFLVLLSLCFRRVCWFTWLGGFSFGDKVIILCIYSPYTQQTPTQTASAPNNNHYPSPELPKSPATLRVDSITDILNNWKRSVEDKRSSVREKWVVEHERLASACEERESQNVENNLGTTAAMLDAGLANLAILQRQPCTHTLSLGNGGGISAWELAWWSLCDGRRGYR